MNQEFISGAYGGNIVFIFNNVTCPKMTLLRFANRVRKFIFVNLLPVMWSVWE